MNANVLILDDDPDSRESLVRSVQASGMQTVAPDGPFATMDSLREYARREGVTHVATDQRLQERSFSSFLGASAAAALNAMKIAPILVTAFARQDMDRDIRPFLNAIPRIVHRKAAVSPSSVRSALEASAAEVIEGQVPRSRRGYRSVVTVSNIIQHQERAPRLVRFMIRQWRNDVTVGFPENALSATIQRALVPGLLLLAQVNIEAESEDTLFLTNFELPLPEDTLDL
jgi:hypothetical protein